MFLSTKITAPRLSPFVVARPALFDKLQQFASYKLTLVTAPAGYGKTTLIAGWLAQQGDLEPRTAWLLLDEYDDDPVRFAHYLIGAIQRCLPDAGITVLEMLQSNSIASQPQRMEEIFTTLIHELTAFATPLLLVIDDLHEIRNPQILDGLRLWCEHTPAHVHTILISRDASMLPIARWRVRQHCNEITVHDLRFALDEAVAFVRRVLRLDLTDAEILQLITRTEGWIAGLQLAAMSLQNAENPRHLLQNFTGSDRHVMDYLVEEVLEKQPAAVRDFLVGTSILKRFSAPLCDFVLQRSDSYQLLEQLEKRNLFLSPLDNQRNWYRYHPLFAEALNQQLQRSKAASMIELHRRAYAWWRDADEPDTAIEHALLAQLYPEAATLLRQQSHVILWQQGRPRIFLQWCKQIPEAQRFAQPGLMIAIGWTYLLLSNYKDLANLTQQMQNRWSVTGFDFAEGVQIRNELALLESEVALHRGDIAQVMQNLANIENESATLHPSTQVIAHQLYGYASRLEGKIDTAKHFLNQAIALLETSDDSALWIYAHSDLAETQAMAGEITVALATFTKILRRFPSTRYPNHHSLSHVYMRMARLLYVQNRLSEAIDSVQQGVSSAGNAQWLSRYGLLMLAEIRLAQGKPSEMNARIEQVQTLQGRRQSPATQLFFATSIAKLHLLHGAVAGAANWYRSDLQQIERVPRYQQHATQVTLARYQLATDPALALSTLDELRQTSQHNHWQESLLEIEILRALAYQTVGQQRDALTALEDALALAEPEQALTPFVIEGAPMAALLRKALPSTSHRAFVGQLQASFLPVSASNPLFQAQPLAEPLSTRELEVLQLLAAGRSNPEIAEQLILATGTVAKHTNNIFGKLGVRNRTEAVQMAQSLGLI